MYAIVRTGGKQERVEEGKVVTVEKLPAEEGATVELTDVLLIAENGDVTVGTPSIEGARVIAEVQSHGRAKKIIVFKYKSKVRSRKKTGHRQAFTTLSVVEILRPGQESKSVKKPRRRRRKAAEEAPGAEAAEETPEAGEAAVAEELPKRRTRRRPAPEETVAEEKPKRTARRRTAKADDEPATGEASVAEEKPARPSRRRTAKPDDAGKDGGEEKPTTTRRRSPRKKSTDETE